jgi:hypothetical protein
MFMCSLINAVPRYRPTESGGEHWEVVSLPAEAEPNDPLGREVGEMLWGDDDYGYANSLRQQKAEQPACNWSALFQQQPAPEKTMHVDGRAHADHR